MSKAPDTQQGFIQDYLAYLLARASHEISAEFHEQVLASGLSVMQWRVLASLSEGPPLSIGALARIVLAQQPTATKLVARMVQEGLVRRLPHPQDKRSVLVTLTALGQRKASPLLKQARTHEAQVLARLPDADTVALKDILRRWIEQSLS
ncbi:MAG: Transcriptional activatory protein BadR [Pseudomonadota bacterium]